MPHQSDQCKRGTPTRSFHTPDQNERCGAIRGDGAAALLKLVAPNFA